MGVRAAFSRAADYQDLQRHVRVASVRNELESSVVSYLERALEQIREPPSQRFVELAAELTMLGAITRRAYHEESLYRQQVDDFVTALADFLNSWSHEGP